MKCINTLWEKNAEVGNVYFGVWFSKPLNFKALTQGTNAALWIHSMSNWKLFLGLVHCHPVGAEDCCLVGKRCMVWSGCYSLKAQLLLYLHIADGWRRFAFLTRWNSVHLQVLLSATPQGGMFPEVSHPQLLLGSLVSISWKFKFTKIVSEFVINF